MSYGALVFILAISLPSLLLFSFLIATIRRKVVTRNSMLFLDLFSILFLIYLATGINLPLKDSFYTNIFLFQVIFFLILGLNLIFYCFYREEVYKNIIDFFFSLPLTILFTFLFFLIFVNVAFIPLVNTLNNLFYTFLITYLNIIGYLLLAYYLTKKWEGKTIYLRLTGGILFISTPFLYILLTPLII